jgi:outer membrane lipoprotein-sorting protein
MKKLALLICSLVLLSGTSLSAQSLDDVLKEHFAATGQEKLIKMNSLKTVGKLLQSGIEIPFTQMAKRPSCMRVEGTFQGLTFIQTYNGKEGWNVNPFTGVTEPQPFNEDELKSMKFSADMDGMLWDWKAKGYTVTLEGKEDMEGTSSFKIKLVTQEGDAFMFYIDSESYVMLRTNSKIKVQGNEMDTDTYYANYMQVEGIALPGKVETKMNGQVVMSIITDKVEFNPELDQSLFEKPAK